MFQFPIALKYSAPLARLDRRTSQAVARSTNRVTAIAEVARVSMDEMSHNLVTAEKLAAESMQAALSLASEGPETDMAAAYLKALTERYLRRMVMLTDMANDTILRANFVDDDD